MNIPKRFKLFGHTISVNYDSKLVNRTNNAAEAHYRFNEIHIQPEDGYVGRPASKIEQDFLHELVHFIFYYGECDATKGLFSNEQVVDRISCLLHQALTTAEYEDTI